MPSTSLSVALSPLEKERFGIRTARADRTTLDALPAILDFCRSEKVELLIARCKAEDLPAVQALEAEGGQLMDTLVYYGRDTQKDVPTVEPSSGSIRSSRAETKRRSRAWPCRRFEATRATITPILV